MEPRGETSGAIVLAGGRSSRMGQSKAMLLFDGTPLITHVVANLRPLFADIVVVAAPGQELPSLPATVVRDDVAYQGPVGGICYGLAAAAADVCFVTACDSAFLSQRLISHLVSQIPDYDVVVPHWQDRLQPLHAVYRRRLLPIVREQLSRGELRVVSLFDKVRTRTIDEAEIRRFDPEGLSFFNMNTPEDYALAVQRLRAIECKVELFGVARLVANTREVSLALPPGATVGDVLATLADRLPALVGRVIDSDRRSLVDGYACNVNGLEFVRSMAAPVNRGDSLVILSADAGG